jgi:hypothetical protein
VWTGFTWLRIGTSGGAGTKKIGTGGNTADTYSGCAHFKSWQDINYLTEDFYSFLSPFRQMLEQYCDMISGGFSVL